MSEKKIPGVDLIASERHRQITKGYTPEIDARLPDGSLSMAAVCYAMDEQLFMTTEQSGGVLYSDPWPWDPEFDHRVKSDGDVVVYKLSLQERIKQLTKAGALIAAEIDNLQFKSRLASSSLSPSPSPVITKTATKTYFAEPEDGVNTYDESRSRSSIGSPATPIGTTTTPAL